MASKEPTGIVRMEPVFLNKQATCEALGGISERSLEQEMRAGNINPRLCMGRVVFTPEEIRRYATEQKEWTPNR